MVGETLLNRYKIESELGRGGMGVVYKAHDTLLNRAVAIKFLNIEGVGTDGKARLLQEARAAAQLNHPNIVSVYDAGETKGNPFIVMELVRGVTLRKTEKLTFSNTIRMAQQICLALDHAHANGIIHRDLKLENIVITNTQTLKLMDFGLARTADDAHLTQEGTLIGTLAYIAPELIQGQPASVQSDLYALGIILYELLVGHEPFQGNIGAVLGQHLHGEVTLPSKFSAEIPNWVDELILSLLSKRPEERPASARAVLDILELKITAPVTAAYTITSKPRNNLPAQNTSFIGREKEIKEVMDALHANRLVTLTGSGGSGKTRLSIQTAANLLEHFLDGVWFVELAPLTDPDLIPQTVLSVLGVSEQAGRPPLDILKTYLQERQTLIVLDNCEHLIEASAKVTDELLNTASELRILASSREALAVKGELSYPVPSLSLPDIKHLLDIEQLTQYEAVRLFVDRATLVAPYFHVDKDNASFVAQICFRLDGIPLALELAAARVKVISVEQISKRLDDRFRLLTSGARTALPRQQTLRATIDWSYNLLSEQEKILLRRLAVFIGGWTLEAVEEVCSGEGIEAEQILDLMSQLVNKSLVAAETTQAETRYRILETVRQYAREKLFDTEEASPMRDKHLAFFVKLAEQAEPELVRSNAVFWFNKLDDELENFRNALEWSLSTSKGVITLRIVGALGQFWWTRSHLEEGREWIRRATVPGNRSNPQSKALYWGSVLARTQEDFLTARKLSNESLKLCRIQNDKEGMAKALGVLGSLDYFEKEYTEAQKAWEEALRLYRELEDRRGIVRVLANLGYSLHTQGNIEKAQELYAECLTICRELEDKWNMQHVLLNMGHIAYAQGNILRAREIYEETLAYCHELGDKDGLAYVLLSLTQVLASERQTISSAQIQGMATQLLDEVGSFLEPVERANYDRTTITLKELMGMERYQKEFEAGKALSLEQAIALALRRE